MCADDANEQIASITNPPLSSRWKKICFKLAAGICLLLLAGAGCHELREMQQMARRASCGNDVFVLANALREYAADHDGLLPPISAIRGNIMMDPDGFYPKYLTNSCWVQCEYSPLRQMGDKGDDLGVFGFNDDSFCYLPWEIKTEKEGLGFIEAYKNLDPKKRHEDLKVEIDGEVVSLPRSRLSANLPGSSADSETFVPMIIEWPNHAHIDAVVWYTDGHGECADIGDKFPMTEEFIAGLRAIAAIDKPIPKWKRK
jgi:hypothetical protein